MFSDFVVHFVVFYHHKSVYRDQLGKRDYGRLFGKNIMIARLTRKRAVRSIGSGVRDKRCEARDLASREQDVASF
jgi:hypothetical protein